MFQNSLASPLVTRLVVYSGSHKMASWECAPVCYVLFHKSLVTYSSITPPSYVNHPDYGPLQNTYQPLSGPGAPAPCTAVDHSHLPQVEKHDLSRYLWYHGRIPREKAEKLLTRDGDFLLRESGTQPGDYVLTCCWRGAALHFMINRQLIQEASTCVQPKVQYQFEEELFDFVPELIQFYASTRKPISESSGVIISHAIPREAPAAAAFYGPKHMQGKCSGSPGQSPRHSPKASPRTTPNQSPALPRRNLPQRMGSQPLSSLSSATDAAAPLDKSKCGSHGSLPSIAHATKAARKTQVASGVSHQRTGSEPIAVMPHQLTRGSHVLTGSEGDLTKPAPPKPSRVPTVKAKPQDRPVIQIRNKELYDDGDRDYSDYDQVKSWPSHLKKSDDAHLKVFETTPPKCNITTSHTLPKATGLSAPHRIGAHSFNTPTDLYDVPKSARASSASSDTYDVPKSLRPNTDVYDVLPSQKFGKRISADSTCDLTPTKLPKETAYTLPVVEPESHFSLVNHDSELLSPHNKPLEGAAMVTIRMLLLESSSRALAQHMTFLDLQLLKVTGSHNLGLGVGSGLELLTLPQGEQLRTDIIERWGMQSVKK